MILVWLGLCHALSGQSQPAPQLVSLSGRVSYRTSFFGSSYRLAEEAAAPRLTHRLAGNVDFNIGRLSLPFHFSLGSPSVGQGLRLDTNAPLWRRFLNPANMSSIGIQRKGLRLAAGTVNPGEVSMLYRGIVPVTGGLVDLNRRRFRILALGGYGLWEVAPDSARGLRGRYRQRLGSVHLRLGKADSTFLSATYMRAEDMATSLPAPLAILPMRSQGIAFAYGLRWRHFYQRGELAANLTSENAGAALLELDTLRKWDNWLALDLFTRPDVSGRLEAGFSAKQTRIGLEAEYWGPENRALYAPFRPYDLAKITGNFRSSWRLDSAMQRTLSVNASAGYQLTNLALIPFLQLDTIPWKEAFFPKPGPARGLKTEQAVRKIARANVSYRHSKQLSGNLFFSNFLQTSVDQTDSLVMRQTTAMAGGQVTWSRASHRLTGILNWSEGQDFYVASNIYRLLDLRTLQLNHNYSWARGRRSLNSFIGYQDQGTRSQWQAGLSHGLRFQKLSARISFSAQYSRIDYVRSGRVQLFGIGLQGSCRFAKRLSLLFTNRFQVRKGVSVPRGFVFNSFFTTNFSF